MGNEAEKDPDAKFKYEDVDVFKVDIVGKPSTGDRFLTIRSEDEKPVSRRAMTKVAIEALRQNGTNDDSIPVVSRPVDSAVDIATVVDEVTKAVAGIKPVEIKAAISGAAISNAIVRQVPPADATPEKKRKAQKARSKKYGIEAWENKGENLTYPKGDPTTESLYGDPTNLKYPLGRSDNKLDKKRATNARARFKQSFARYEKAKSRKVIHTRIVKAELKAGSNPAYDPNDDLDKLLPKEVRDKMQQPVERTGDENEPETTSEEEMKNLDAGLGRLEKLVERMEGVFSNVLKMDEVDPANPDDPKPEEKPDDEEGPAPAPEDEPEPEETPAPEENPATPPEAPEDVPKEPEASEPPPVQTPEPTVDQAPVPVPASADPAQLEALSTSVGELSAMVERMGDVLTVGMEGVNTKLGGITGRVDKVERSIRSGGNSEEDGTEGPIERGDGNSKPTLFSNIL